MYLKQSVSNGKIYLSFVQGYRLDGKVKQKTIEKLGYLEDLQKIYNDPIEHFKGLAKELPMFQKRHFPLISLSVLKIIRILAKI